MIAYTYDSLTRWHNSLFEKLGWMVLNKAQTSGDRTDAEERRKKSDVYIISIKRCLEAINARKEIESDTSKRVDLNLMSGNLDILLVHAKKDLTQAGGKRNSRKNKQ